MEDFKKCRVFKWVFRKADLQKSAFFIPTPIYIGDSKAQKTLRPLHNHF